jgi:hypothetical protein
VNAVCLGKAEDAFANAFQKAEEKGGCVPVPNAATLSYPK